MHHYITNYIQYPLPWIVANSHSPSDQKCFKDGDGLVIAVAMKQTNVKAAHAPTHQQQEQQLVQQINASAQDAVAKQGHESAGSPAVTSAAAAAAAPVAEVTNLQPADSGSTATHAPHPSSSSKPKPASASSGLQSCAARYLVPAVVVAATAFTWLLRRARSSGGASTNISRRRQSQNSHEQSEQQAPPPLQEPEFARGLYASNFRLLTQDVPLVARPAALEGLTCAVSEHIPIQVRTPTRPCVRHSP